MTKVYVIVQGHDEAFHSVHASQASAEAMIAKGAKEGIWDAVIYESELDGTLLNVVESTCCLNARPVLWTNESPIRPGFYWARPTFMKWITPVHVVAHLNGDIDVGVPGHIEDYKLADFDLWAGPIEAPQMPEGE